MGPIFCYLKGCTKCRGDLVFDDGEWKCFQCGRYVPTSPAADGREPYPKPLQMQASSEIRDGVSANGKTGIERQRQRDYGATFARDINSVIQAKRNSDEKWWARNRHIIECLDQGLSVRETARLVGRGDRQIRVVRERLSDIRAEAVMFEGKAT